MRRVVVLLAVFGVVAGAHAVPASALTKLQADAIAIRATGVKRLAKDVALLGLPKPLPGGTHVAPADPAGQLGTPGKRRATTLRAPAWLYWLDLNPYARFSHPSTFLLVDDRSGRVTRRSLQWFPLVNGKEPPFVASRAAYDAKRYRVFARERPLAPPKAGSRDAPGFASPLATISPRLLEDDCVIMIGDYNTAGVSGDFPAVQKWAKSVGLRAFYATRHGPSGSAPAVTSRPPDGEVLAANVKALVTVDRCTDVLVYMSGHGARAGEGPPTVFTGKTVDNGDGSEPVVTHEGVDAVDVATVIRDNPTVGFKLKVDSCFAGRFVKALTDPRLPPLENLLVIEASSSSTQPSYSALSAKRRADNPDRVGEFTNQNLVGLRTWASSPDEVASSAALGGSLFTHALERAFTLGRSGNRSITARAVKPVLWVNRNPALERLVLSHWHPPGGRTSFLCGTVTGRSGAKGTFTARGPGGFTFSVPFDVQPTGTRNFNARIGRAGTYVVTASAGGIGLKVEYTVPPPSGPAKGPIDCSQFPQPGG